MIDLEELKRKGLIKKARDIINSNKRERENALTLKDVFPEGEFIETPYKNVFKVRNIYDINEYIGEVSLGDIFNFKYDLNYFLTILSGNENLKEFEFEKLLFFDVESTGLSSGAGNMVFLIGLGYFEDNRLVIDQYFIEDYINEKGLLYILENEFKKRSHLISYNGKSFDFYVLKNRFILSRKFQFKLNNLLHYDLLHISRRMWKDILSEFSLINIEKHILKFYRNIEDIPGYLIPIYYKEYLKFHNALKVKNIFYHNLMDVKSMIGILIKQVENIEKILNKNFPDTINPVSTGKLFKKRGDLDIYKEILIYNLEAGYLNKEDTYKELILLYKKEKNYKKFLDLTYTMIEEFPDSPFSYIEAIKYYEHIEKDYNKALILLQNLKEKISDEKLIDDVIKREDRIRKKCLKD